MAFTSLKVAVPSLPPAGKDSLFRRPDGLRLAENDFQAIIKTKQPKLICNISRRDAVSSMSAALLANFLAIDAAEARNVKPETRRKIREKLDKLREKAGLPKEKNGSDTVKKEKELPKSPPNGISVDPLVEANL